MKAGFVLKMNWKVSNNKCAKHQFSNFILAQSYKKNQQIAFIISKSLV